MQDAEGSFYGNDMPCRDTDEVMIRTRIRRSKAKPDRPANRKANKLARKQRKRNKG